MRKRIIVTAILGVALLCTTAMANGPHEHGVARMNVTVDGSKVEIALESPLANAISFEHAPTTDAQRAEVRAMSATLRKAGEIFQMTKAAQCSSSEVFLVSESLPPELLGETTPVTGSSKLGYIARDYAGAGGEGHKKREGHDGLDAFFIFECAKPEAVKNLDVQLFRIWPTLHELKARLITPAGQKDAELTSKKHTLTW